MNPGQCFGRCLCLGGILAALTACGTSGPPTEVTTTTAAGGTPTEAPQSSAAASHQAGGCEAALQAFAREKRIAGSERAAVQVLIDSLAKHPVALRCASMQATVLGATAAYPGKPDYNCLGAATDIRLLMTLPIASAPVQGSARRAAAIIDISERRGAAFCAYP